MTNARHTLAALLICTLLLSLIGCSRTENDTAKSPAPSQSADTAKTTTGDQRHPVVATVRKFLQAIADSKYDRAVEMAVPGKIRTDALQRVSAVLDFDNASITHAYVADRNAAVLTGPLASSGPPMQFGHLLEKKTDRWRIHTMDLLPDAEAAEQWIADFKNNNPPVQTILKTE